MNDTLRVGMVTARALPFMGGIETHVHEVSWRLAALGVDVTVLTTDTTGELPTDEITSGYRIRRWPAYPRSATTTSPRVWPVIWWARSATTTLSTFRACIPWSPRWRWPRREPSSSPPR